MIAVTHTEPIAEAARFGWLPAFPRDSFRWDPRFESRRLAHEACVAHRDLLLRSMAATDRACESRRLRAQVERLAHLDAQIVEAAQDAAYLTHFLGRYLRELAQRSKDPAEAAAARRWLAQLAEPTSPLMSLAVELEATREAWALHLARVEREDPTKDNSNGRGGR